MLMLRSRRRNGHPGDVETSIARCIARSPARNWAAAAVAPADHTAHSGSARSLRATAASCSPSASMRPLSVSAEDSAGRRRPPPPVIRREGRETPPRGPSPGTRRDVLEAETAQFAGSPPMATTGEQPASASASATRRAIATPATGIVALSAPMRRLAPPHSTAPIVAHGISPRRECHWGRVAG